MDWIKYSDGVERKPLDGDTLIGKDGSRVRISGMDTYEVDHGYEGDWGTNQGLVQKRILELLTTEKGYNKISLSGKDNRRDDGKKRDLGVVTNEHGQSVASKMYYEGLVTPRGKNVRNEDIQVYKQGLLARNNNPLNVDPFYEQLRQDLAISSTQDNTWIKQRAVTEEQFNPKAHLGVMFRSPSDRDIYNQADNAFLSGLSGGLDGIQAGYYGVMEMFGNKTGMQAIENYGKSGLRIQEFQQDSLPEYITNIDNINSVSDFSQWAAGALGGSLPYFGIMAAGFIPGLAPVSVGSMALTYAGQTWNAMEGLPDEKSAAIALQAGILQSAWERIGGRAVFSLVKPKDLATDKGVNKAINEIVNSGRKSAKTGKVITREEAADIIKRAKKEEIISTLKAFGNNSAIWSAYSTQVAKRAGAGIIGEGTTEGMQEATQYIGAYLGSPERLRKFQMEDTVNAQGRTTELGFVSILKNAIAAGALLGGGIAGGKAALTESTPYSSNVRDYDYFLENDTTTDTSPVSKIRTVLTAAGRRFLDPTSSYNKDTIPSEQAAKQRAFKNKNAAIKEFKKQDYEANVKPAFRKERTSSLALMMRNIRSKVKPSKEKITADTKRINGVRKQLGKNPLEEKEVAALYGTRLGKPNTKRDIAENKELKEQLKEIENKHNQTVKDYVPPVNEESKIDEIEESSAANSQAQKNANTVNELVDQHKENQKQKPTGTKTGEFILGLKFLSAPMEVLRKELGDIWNNLDILRAEAEYIGLPFGRFFSGKTMVQERRTLEGQFHLRLRNILNEVIGTTKPNGRTMKESPKNRRIIFDRLQEYAENKELDPRFEAWKPSFDKALFQIDAFETDMEIKIREVDPHYYRRTHAIVDQETGQTTRMSLDMLLGRKLSPDKVKNNKETYIKAVMGYHKWSRTDAEKEYEKIIGTPTGWNYQEWADTKFLSKKPSYIKRRVNYSNEAFKSLWEDNTYDVALTRITEMAHYVSDMRSKGFGGAILNSKILAIQEELVAKYGQETADKEMPKIAFEIYRHYEMHMGEYHKIKSDKARALAAHTASFLSFAYMGMAVFSSIPEIGLMFRDVSGLTVDGQKMYVKSLKNMAKLTKQSMVAQMKKIVAIEGNWADTSYRDKMLANQIGRGMTGKEYGAGHVVDAEFGMDRKHWLQSKAMPIFYKWTGLTPYTTLVRMGRDTIAIDWLAVQLGDMHQTIEEITNEYAENLRTTNEKNLKDQALEEYIANEISFLQTTPEGILILQKLVDAKLLNRKQAGAFKKLRNAGIDPIQNAVDFKLLVDQYASGLRGLRGLKGEGHLSEQIVQDPIHQKFSNVQFDQWLDILLSDADLVLEKDQEGKLILDRGRPVPIKVYDDVRQSAKRLASNLDLARSNFVDQALVNPDPGKRPPMYSDGRTRLLFMFQGYLSQFSSQIAKPILMDLAGKGAPSAQINAAAVMLTATALAFLGQAFKDEIKYGDKPAWLSDAQYIQRGIMASGLLGQTERIFNFMFPLYQSEEDTLANKFYSELGPITGAVDAITKGSKWTAEGEGERALNQFLKIAPGGTFTRQRQFAAEVLSGNYGEE